MARPVIVEKLTKELNGEISTEAQVVYVMVEIRKLLELNRQRERYPSLNFHCSWAVHVEMTKKAAQKILRYFDKLHPLLQKGLGLSDLSRELQTEFDQLAGMEKFRTELKQFLEANDLPFHWIQTRWTNFLSLYGQVIEDCPLKVGGKMEGLKVRKVVVTKKDAANQPDKGYQWYRLRWSIYDDTEQPGHLDVYFTNP